ncbi:hypothetical protein RP20_CCG009112 [Aedes albopictus]|nr:hypothetical protein RP20_CCG009112 [Aedes albopictus]
MPYLFSFMLLCLFVFVAGHWVSKRCAVAFEGSYHKVTYGLPAFPGFPKAFPQLLRSHPNRSEYHKPEKSSVDLTPRHSNRASYTETNKSTNTTNRKVCLLLVIPKGSSG